MNFNLEDFDDREEEDDIQEIEQVADQDEDDDNNNDDNDDDDDENDVQEDKDDDDDDNDDDDDEDALDHEAHELIPAGDSPRGLFSRRSEIINTLFQKLNNPFVGSSSSSSNTFKWTSNASKPDQPSLCPSDDGFLAWMKEKNRRKEREFSERLEKDRLIEKPRSLWQDLRIGSESKEKQDDEEEDEDNEDNDNEDDDKSENDEDDDDIIEEEEDESDENSQHESHDDDSVEKSPGDSTKQSQSDKSTGIDQPHSSQANSKRAQALLKTDSTNSSSTGRLSDSAIEEASLQPLDDKLRTYKRFRQTLIHSASPAAARRFLCEIIYDQIEEEVAVKMKYLPATIGYLFFSKTLTIRFLSRMIEDKEMRVNKAKDIMRLLTCEGSSKRGKEKKEKLSKSSTNNKGRTAKNTQNGKQQQQQQPKLLLQQALFVLGKNSSDSSSYEGSKQQQQSVTQKKQARSMKTQEQKQKQAELKKSMSSKDKLFYSCRIMQWLGECKAKSSDPAHQFRILQQLNQRRHSLEGYQNCQVLRDILRDILQSAAMKYFNNSKIAQLITPFLLETDISINFFVKCLLKPQKHGVLFSTPARIVVALAQRHKSLLA